MITVPPTGAERRHGENIQQNDYKTPEEGNQSIHTKFRTFNSTKSNIKGRSYETPTFVLFGAQ